MQRSDQQLRQVQSLALFVLFTPLLKTKNTALRPPFALWQVGSKQLYASSAVMRQGLIKDQLLSQWEQGQCKGSASLQGETRCTFPFQMLWPRWWMKLCSYLFAILISSGKPQSHLRANFYVQLLLSTDDLSPRHERLKPLSEGEMSLEAAAFEAFMKRKALFFRFLLLSL